MSLCSLFAVVFDILFHDSSVYLILIAIKLDLSVTDLGPISIFINALKRERSVNFDPEMILDTGT